MRFKEIRINTGKKFCEEEDYVTKSIKRFVESYEDVKNIVKNCGRTGQYSDFICSMRMENHRSGIEVLRREREQGNILYAACSFGLGVKLIESFGYSVMGIDIDKYAIRQGKERNLDVRVMNAFNMDFPDNSFDIAISRDFLRPDYLGEDLKAAFLEQARTIKKGGILINYSALADPVKDDNWNTAKKEMQDPGFFEDLPFDELRRYEVYYDAVKKFVDVLEK